MLPTILTGIELVTMEVVVVIGVVVAYMAGMIAIGIWASTGSEDMAGYYLAGKKLPSWVVAFSFNATGESAWLLLGLTGMGYLVGIHALWVVFGEALGICLAWVLISRPLKEYTDRFDSITVPDFLEDRFRDESGLLRRLSVLVIFSMVAVYLAAQLTATGVAFDDFLGLNYATGVIVGTAIVVCYTVTGGFKAVAYTDAVQGMLMAAGLVILPLVGIAAAGGWGGMIETLRAADPSLLLPMGSDGISVAGVMSALSFAAVGLAFLGVPQLLTRFMSTRSLKEMPRASLVAVPCVLVFDLGAVLTGMAGRAVFPGLADSESIYPTLATNLFPAIFTGLFFVVLLAAIMSTASSLLILASSSVVRDLVQKIYRPTLSEHRLSIYGKITTLIIGAIALIVALGEVRLIFWFVLFAWSGLGSAFVPVTLCALFWKRTTRAGAVAGIVSGFAVTIVWVVAFKAQFYDLYEMIPGVTAGLLATIVVSLFTAPPAGAAEEFESVWKTIGKPLQRAPEPTAVPAHGRRADRPVGVGQRD